MVQPLNVAPGGLGNGSFFATTLPTDVLVCCSAVIVQRLLSCGLIDQVSEVWLPLECMRMETAVGELVLSSDKINSWV